MANSPATNSLENQLSEINKLSDYLTDNREHLITDINLSVYLDKLLKQTGCRKSEIIRRTNLNRAYVYQIFEGKKIPSRDKLIAIAAGMRLDLDETQKLLKYAGFRTLYARDARDAAIIFAFMHGSSFDDMNAALYENKMKIIE